MNNFPFPAQVQRHPRSYQARVCQVCQSLSYEPPRPGKRPHRYICMQHIENFELFFLLYLPTGPPSHKNKLNQTIWHKKGFWLYWRWPTISLIWFCFPFAEYLKVRSHDPEEAIRHDVIVSIVTAAKKDLSLVNDALLNFVKERTLDKRVSRGPCMYFNDCVAGNPELNLYELHIFIPCYRCTL